MVSIRFLEEKDIPELANLYLKLRRHTMNMGGTQDVMINYINQRRGKNNYFIYIATVNNNIVGTIAFEIKTKKNAAISDAYVELDYRKQGILKALEQSVIKHLKAQGVETIDLVVRVNNEEGKATWSSLGYKTIMEVRKKSI
ncbi:MAG: GNAT family N-acetyltransferase [Candidatus Odinarchaeota archaeon]